VNLAATLAAAKRAQAAYIDDTNSSMGAFQMLGYSYIGQYQNTSHQAVLSHDDAGQIYLSISGTRFSQRKIGDLLCDIDTKPFNVGDGAMVAKGAYEGLDDMWRWTLGLTPPGTVLTIDGHSLGAGRALFTPLFLPSSQIGDVYAFESPKFANAKFWEMYPLDSAVHTVNEADIFYGYPFVGDQMTHPDRDVLWLRNFGLQVIRPNQWPRGFSIPNHGIDSVISNLEKITTL
jgi:hypothetical protein